MTNFFKDPQLSEKLRVRPVLVTYFKTDGKEYWGYIEATRLSEFMLTPTIESETAR